MAGNLLFKGDFHIHSKYSYDSNIEPENILRRASKFGMNVISITDHETLEGSMEAKEIGPKYGIDVWPGMEISTNVGDIIGVKLQDEVQQHEWRKVISEIRGQNGITILPHPYRGHKMIEELAASVDIIEVFNGHDNPINVIRSIELAIKYRKPGIAGSDAHVLSEVGKVINEFQDIMSFEKNFHTMRANRFEYTYSRLINDLKRKQYGKIPFEILNFIRW